MYRIRFSLSINMYNALVFALLAGSLFVLLYTDEVATFIEKNVFPSIDDAAKDYLTWRKSDMVAEEFADDTRK